jgi:hypothetical protein
MPIFLILLSYFPPREIRDLDDNTAQDCNKTQEAYSEWSCPVWVDGRRAFSA